MIINHGARLLFFHCIMLPWRSAFTITPSIPNKYTYTWWDIGQQRQIQAGYFCRLWGPVRLRVRVVGVSVSPRGRVAIWWVPECPSWSLSHLGTHIIYPCHDTLLTLTALLSIAGWRVVRVLEGRGRDWTTASTAGEKGGGGAERCWVTKVIVYTVTPARPANPRWPLLAEQPTLPTSASTVHFYTSNNSQLCNM